MTSPDALALLGTWHLGSVSAAAWTQAEIPVVAWDPDSDVRASLRAGRALVIEAGVDEALTAAVESGLLRVVDDARTAVAAASVTHLAIDTRVDERGSPADARLDEAVSCFAAAAPDSALLVVSSQVEVGTTERWREQLEREQRGLLVAHTPENLRLGSALRDFTKPPRLIIGADDDEAFRRAAALFEVVGTTPTRLSLVSAEMSKHATNAYLALCVAFANELAWLSLSVGADPNEVAMALRDDPRVSPSAPLRPGTAFSGATLMRDLVVLSDLGAKYGRPDLFDAVIRANERHAQVALAWLEDSLGSLAGRRVAVVGLTYKPGTSTLRDSLPLKLVSQLLERGATVAAWDPAAEPFDPPAGFIRAASFEASVEGADALAVMTALPQLGDVDWRKLRPARRLVIDGCMGVDRDAAESAGWSYRGLARGRATVASVTTPTPTRRTLYSRPRRSDVGPAGRGIRFALAGGIVALVYFSVTTSLHEGLGVPFQIALLTGFVTALTVHFILQRTFVWVHVDGFALATSHQASRYLAVAATQYSVTAAATALLPGLLGVRVTYVYLVTAVLTTIVTFLVFRTRVFHPAASSST